MNEWAKELKKSTSKFQLRINWDDCSWHRIDSTFSSSSLHKISIEISMPDHQKCLSQLARPQIPMIKVLTQITKSDTAPHCLSSKPLWIILANSSSIESMCSREASLHEMWVMKANPHSVPPPMAALGCPYCLMFQKQIWRKSPVWFTWSAAKAKQKRECGQFPGKFQGF